MCVYRDSVKTDASLLLRHLEVASVSPFTDLKRREGLFTILPSLGFGRVWKACTCLVGWGQLEEVEGVVGIPQMPNWQGPSSSSSILRNPGYQICSAADCLAQARSESYISSMWRDCMELELSFTGVRTSPLEFWECWEHIPRTPNMCL